MSERHVAELKRKLDLNHNLNIQLVDRLEECDAEIKRLKDDVEYWKHEHEISLATFETMLDDAKEKDAEIQRLRKNVRMLADMVGDGGNSMTEETIETLVKGGDDD